MQFRRYVNTGVFRPEVLEILTMHEVQNNLLIGLITDRKSENTADWLLATVSDGGGLALTAICIRSFHLLIYETNNIRNDEAVDLLVKELRKAGWIPPSVMAESTLARRFARAFSPDGEYYLHMSLTAMKLDKPAEYIKAPGFYRALEARDMLFAPYWERAFSEDCRTTVFTIAENTERLKTRLGKGTHFLWEDGLPVSQAVHGRNTPNGALINGVYTPPEFRGRGYASSVVAELSNSLLRSGKDFCCLFADADNSVSLRLYRKLGYYDVCDLEDIRFNRTCGRSE